MAHLTAAEQARYTREGWVVPEWRLPKPRVDAMREALDALIAANPGVRPEKLVSAHIEGRNAEGVNGSRAFFDLATDKEIVELPHGLHHERDLRVIASHDRPREFFQASDDLLRSDRIG